ncbi:MAG TPA: dockerin type I domain-containing protein, partial [Chthoniobacterales bacterium]
ARSDDGGLTFGPVVEIDPPADAHCVGIHGHVQVGPDGTVYVPTCNCDGMGSVIASTDNGITWTIRHVPGTKSTLVGSNGNIIDAQVRTDSAGKLYFAMAHTPVDYSTGSTAVVATSTDQGQTWQNIYDLGADVGIQNIEFPYVAAADSGRAAVAFLGTTTAGDPSTNGFNGIWHLYVAATYDGGATWTTTDATPNDPLQRGCVWNKGGANICRNLLDFIGADVDNQGRIEVGYVDGCADGACDQATMSNTHFIGNGYTARGVIARQSSGRRLVAQFDPATSTSVPGMPLINARRLNGVVHLSWSLADSGNLPITSYNVLRGTVPGNETLLTTVSGSNVGGAYDDASASGTGTYYYKVVAVNSSGASCANNELAVPYVGDTCNGLILQKNPPNHPEQTTQGQTPPSLAIDYIAVAEPTGTNDIVFKMKVSDLHTVPPNSRWRLVWNWEGATGQQYYVGMRTDASSAETFDYGHIATAVVGLVLGVPTETAEGSATGTATPDGLITITVPRAAIGNPQPGDLLGAVNGRTFTGDTPQTANLERSNALMDHTFVKGQRDNGHPAATYFVTGNVSCSTSAVAPVSAVSRKTHGNNAGTFDVDLQVGGPIASEPRTGGPNGNHTVIINFATPVTVNSVTATPASGGTANVASSSVDGSTVTVNLTNVSNAQIVRINLNGTNNGTAVADVPVYFGALVGDSNNDGTVNSADATQTRNRSGQTVDASNFRSDGNLDGVVNSADATIIRNNSGSTLKP